VARGDWGFDGYITSDCDADADVYNKHHYYSTPEETVAGVLKAGTDVDCTSFVGRNAASALAKGLIDEKLIDERLAMLFKVRIRLGHFDPVGPLQSFPMSDVCSEYSTTLSNDGPTQAAALIKNDKMTLPLSKATKTVAIIGPNANLSKSDMSYYGPHEPCGGNYWTLADAVASASSAKVSVTLGVPSVLSNDMSGIAAAVAAAKDADEVILAVGTDLSWAHEEHDAQNITFTAAQAALIAQVSAAAKKPVTLVMYTATPLDLTAVLANDKVGAVMHVGQPSSTILGVGKLLFGDISPAGRTVQTVYEAAYADMVSIFDFNMRPGPSAFPRPDCQGGCGATNGTNPGRTHRFYTGKAVVPFGFGLSYTSWAYAAEGPSAVDLAPVRKMLDATTRAGRTFPSSTLSAQQDVNYMVKVTNTGKMDADDVVLGFMVPPGAGTNGVPLQTLFGFERVHVKAGQTVTVNLYPALTDFTTTNLDGTKSAIAGEWTVKFGVKETFEHGQGYTELKLTTF